jgi:hypothetical protein
MCKCANVQMSKCADVVKDWIVFFLAKNAKIKTRKERKEIMNKEHLCHSRIVATALSRGLPTQNDNGGPLVILNEAQRSEGSVEAKEILRYRSE